MTDSNIKDLCPELLIIYQKWLVQCHEAGLATKAIITWRSGIDQNIAQANGLSNATAGKSPHNCCDANRNPSSKAFDFAIFDNGQYIKDGEDPRYKQAGEIGKSLGLVWGGDWHRPDWDHLELTNWENIT